MKPTPASYFNRNLPKLVATIGLGATVLAFVGGCETAFERIDRRTAELLAQSTASLGADAIVPRDGARRFLRPIAAFGPRLAPGRGLLWQHRFAPTESV